jgi:hypothetical protein
VDLRRRPAFRGLAEVGLLEPISAELHRGANDALWQSLGALDAYRARFEGVPDTFTNPVLLGSLLVPLGFTPRASGREPAVEERSRSGPPPPRVPGPRLGELPLARRDVERLSQIIMLQRRMRDLAANPRAQSALTHRSIFREALTWLDVHGGAPPLVDHWNTVVGQRPATEETSADHPPRRRRRRRRRRFRPTPS